MGRYVEERSYKRFAEACLETTIVMYVDRLLIQVCIYQLEISTFRHMSLMINIGPYTNHFGQLNSDSGD